MTPLVLLHAFPLDSTMYDGVRERLSPTTQLLTPDLLGFGAVPVASGEPDVATYANAVAAELDLLGIDQVVIGGTSMGGYVAMAFARLFADRVIGLALLDTRATADAAEGAAGRRGMADQLERELVTAPLLDIVFPRLLGSTSFAERPNVVGEVRTVVARCSPLGAAWAQRAMAARPDSTATLTALSVPAAVIVGEEDQLTPPTDAHAMVQDLTDAALTVVPRAGHLTPLEDPDAVVQALNDLLARVRRRGSD